MSDAYRLYDLLDSPFCLKARICLSLKRVPYERTVLTLARLKELRQLNALGKVPVLVADGETVSDSSQIARWLEQRVPKPALVPKDPSARAYCHLLEEWADESLYFIIGGFKWLNPANRARAYAASAELVPPMLPSSLVLPLVRRSITRRYRAAGYRESNLPHLRERMAENLAYLQDMLLDKPFLLGKYATLADIAVFAQLRWLCGYAEKQLLDAVPTVQTWMEQLEALDEIQQAIRAESPGLDAPAATSLPAEM